MSGTDTDPRFRIVNGRAIPRDSPLTKEEEWEQRRVAYGWADSSTSSTSSNQRPERRYENTRVADNADPTTQNQNTSQQTSSDQQSTAADVAQGSRASNYSQYIGQSVGSGQCVALVQRTDPAVGRTATWTRGGAVQGNLNLAPGTAIATFNAEGRYANSTDGSSHAAIYLRQDAGGIYVQDQWSGHPASERYIRFRNGRSSAVNDGNAYHVIVNRSQ